ncbi:hypothetical protein HXX76_007862 [Chlamydomonas incerta]|uniref:AB hydrolase-1 domain-containing protein n=1 Tax=Chlamydomonas incerta TaxID=51695 RepID=A0A835T9R9_CHLIN|nr:hypothetical protein HXX76_007862 [Chlamydomonas incerta]|eukprot:KAG2434135.1 hypothetical protein HXX76_007862 [Chlamydomonas incerta]
MQRVGLSPGSRHEAAFLHPHAEKHGLRVLAINRPGVGRSSLPSAPAKYDFPTVVEAVRQLLDSAGLRRVVFMGTSGGGPYAAACAALLPERTAAVCLVASMTHTRNAPGLLRGMALSNRLGYLAINHAPRLCGGVMAAGTQLLQAAGALGLGPVAAAAAAAARQQAAREEGADRTEHARVQPGAGVMEGVGSSGGGAGVADRLQAGEQDGGRGGGRERGGGDAMASAAPPAGTPTAAVAAGNGGAVRRAAAGSALSEAATAAMLIAAGFSRADRLAVARAMRQQPELVALMAGSGTEALAQGLEGLWADMRLTSEPWGLPLERITAPTFVWQGTADLNVTPAMARHLAAAIPGAAGPGRLRLVPGAGHISLGLDHGAELVEQLAAALREQERQEAEL